MEHWFIIFISFCTIIAYVIKLSNNKSNLPPGPLAVPPIGNFIWLREPFSEVGKIIRRLKPLYGPLITIKIGRRPLIFIISNSIAHRALIQSGAVFADRPPTILKGALQTIATSSYGPTWRLLRRNLTHNILHPGRVKSHSTSRKWVLSILLRRLRNSSESVKLIDHTTYSIFSLLLFMCFGHKLEEREITQIKYINNRMLNALNFWPFWISKIVFPKKWKDLVRLRKDQDDVLIPLIRARLESLTRSKEVKLPAYIDTLVDIELPEENNRKLDETEMVALCIEFLNAGTDSTSTVLEWIMANLVKHPQIQTKLYNEISSIVGQPSPNSLDDAQIFKVVEEEDLQMMPYLKAVVLEGLRRHPPGHVVLPHKVTEEVELEGYKIPTNGIVNFMVADMGWNPEVWEDPMEFKPERFLNEEGVGFDITSSREVKMMPFGAGRRICPALGMAMLHLEYFVANLIWYFEWKTLGGGDEVDLTEKQEFTVVMKNPLCARISSRAYLISS